MTLTMPMPMPIAFAFVTNFAPTDLVVSFDLACVLSLDILFQPMALLVSAIWMCCSYYQRHYSLFVWLAVWSWCEFGVPALLDCCIELVLVSQRRLLLLSSDFEHMDYLEMKNKK